MALKRWLPLLGAILAAALLTAVQTSLSRVLMEFGILPDPRLRMLLAAFVFVAGLIASFRPVVREEACSLWRCCFRGLLWGVLLGGFSYEFSPLLNLLSLLRKQPEWADPRPSVVIFGVVWTFTFTVFAHAANELRRSAPAR